MSMYIPEIKKEVSESAKMLVEDGGKIVRTGMPSGGSVIIADFVDFDGGKIDYTSSDILEFFKNGITFLLNRKSSDDKTLEESSEFLYLKGFSYGRPVFTTFDNTYYYVNESGEVYRPD